MIELKTKMFYYNIVTSPGFVNFKSEKLSSVRGHTKLLELSGILLADDSPDDSVVCVSFGRDQYLLLPKDYMITRVVL